MRPERQGSGGKAYRHVHWRGTLPVTTIGNARRTYSLLWIGPGPLARPQRDLPASGTIFHIAPAELPTIY